VFSDSEKNNLLLAISKVGLFTTYENSEMVIIDDYLEKEGYVKVNGRLGPVSHYICSITTKGEVFLKRGGFNGKLSSIMNKQEVFIVHGRDNEVKESVARVIEKLGFEAIILHEMPNGGKTIIEKFEDYSNVVFAVVLYTQCDKGGLNASDSVQKPRARQNVIFEHGFFVGKLGRNKTCALVKSDNIEIPTDLSGIVYITMDNEGAWKVKLAKEMKESGCDVDLNRLLQTL